MRARVPANFCSTTSFSVTVGGGMLMRPTRAFFASWMRWLKVGDAGGVLVLAPASVELQADDVLVLAP